MKFSNPFAKKCCEICKTEYDAYASSCPECGKKNSRKDGVLPFAEDRILGPYRELLCFIVGWALFQYLGFVVSLIFQAFGMKPIGASFISAVNYTVYGVLFVFLLSIIAPKIPSLFSRFLTKDTLRGLFVFAAVVAFDTIWGSLIIRIGATTNKNQSAVNDIVSYSPLLSLLFVGIVGPICEEITYRLGLFTFLKRINKVLAFIAVTIFFGAIHLHDITSLNEWLSLPSYIFAGFAFTYAYDKWGPGASIIAHVSTNSLAVLVSLL